MAHRGTLYPLALRRDFNLNVDTYRGGLADRYDCTLPFFPAGFLAILSGSVWRCSAKLEIRTGVYAWLSSIQHFGAFNLRVRMELEIKGVPAGAYRRVYLEQIGIEDIVIWQPQADGTQFSNWSTDAAGKLIFAEPALFPLPPIGLPQFMPVLYPP